LHAGSGRLPTLALHRWRKIVTVANRWDRVALIGIGLLGGSIGLALRRRGLARQVVGVGRDGQRLAQAVQAGVITEAAADLTAAVAHADVVVVATPVDRIEPMVRQVVAAADSAQIITDVGSVKAPIVDGLADLPDEAPFVGSHPLAGSERSGFEYADADLLEGRVVFVTPTDATPPRVTEQAGRFWEALGARVERMAAREHDRVMAAVSHLPHVVAAALAASVPTFPQHYFGSGFRDTTRLAAGSVEMWVPILLQNQSAVLESLRHFRDSIEDWERALAAADPRQLADLLAKGKQRRDALGS